MFEKYSRNPVIARTPNTFFSVYAANPDILEFQDKLHFYFRGQGDTRHDQMGVAVTTKESFDGINWDMIYPNPIITVGPDPFDFDSNHILDPASTVFHDQVYLYYSAHSMKIPHSVCLAVSKDGIHFEKCKNNPIIRDAIAPEVVVKDGKVYLFYQRWTAGSKGVSTLYVCESDDGINFDTSKEQIVMTPEGCVHSISTNRIFLEGNKYYSFHGVNERYKDYPESIGIAVSDDLIHWHRSDKTIIRRGEPGSWDEGALWFATVFIHGGEYYLWYEGTGTANGRTDAEAIKASDSAVNEDYGGYGKTNFSQIGLAKYKGKLEEFFE